MRESLAIAIHEQLAALIRERDAAEAQLAAARAVLEAYERWEADLILEAKAWADGLPLLTQELYDRFMAIQEQRNRALGRFALASQGEQTGEKCPYCTAGLDFDDYSQQNVRCRNCNGTGTIPSTPTPAGEVTA